MNTSFLDACNRREPAHTPVWFMRQAGRYLPSYRAVKGGRPVTEIARDPELSSQVAVDAVEALGVDAGILFADIMLPLEGMGVRFRIEENVGPIVENPVRTGDDVGALRALDPEADVGFVLDGIDATLQKLDDSVPLIGFSGAPFTLAGYMVEGRPSRDLERTKRMMYNDPDAWHGLMRALTRMVKAYLGRQVSHGVHAVQLFDSWVGCLSPADYRTYVSKYTRQIMDSLEGKVPRIHFCANSSSLLGELVGTGADVISVDWRMPISDAWKAARGRGVQGNLDPVLALAGGAAMRRGVARVLEESKGRRGHIFSLGHGVLKETPPENLRAVVRSVHAATRRRA
ncbi:MAG: uroporphyrinogen decarboxylase [Nitrososphaerota archaeon]|nr:uroporphyrinogen decarboxylase [Nitrososphaerota archaeon]MDG6966561.1 uroporphyrinogen decarboxylase [Nitrososphaerota archaeon]MDG6978580.1 uroporphyrinogen decarboxylase [Nitrososphaerota archaeon]MDG7022482.1 uroporphyrinogen decarboxylase [Nitrososphaerota archaeon]